MRLLLAILLIGALGSAVYGQDPVASFNSPSEVCLNEVLSLENTSTDAVTYQWDFCNADFETINTFSSAVTLTGHSQPRALELVFDGEDWFGFVTDFGNNTFFRLSFGGSLDNVPAMEDLGDFGVLDRPYGMQFTEEGGNWYGIVANFNSSNLIRFSFGNSLANTPSTEDLGNVGVINRPGNISLAMDGTDYVLVVGNRNANTVAVVNFGNSITNTPMLSDGLVTGVLTGLSTPSGMDLIEEGGNWYAIMGSNGNGNVLRLDFGSTLFSTPTATTIASGFNQPTNTFIKKTGDQFYGMVVKRGTGIETLVFGTDITNASPTVTDLGNDFGFSNAFGYDMDHFLSQWWGLSVNSSTGEVRRVLFDTSCLGSVETSTDFEPEVSFAATGTYDLQLAAFNADGKSDVAVGSVFVNTSVAPSIDFSFDNVCLGSTTTFTGTSSGTVVSWDWDFGDGNNDMGQVVSNDYMGVAQYQVTLDIISDNGCPNTSAKVVEIFNPPTADFDNPVGISCSSEELTFTNQSTVEMGAPVSYLWDFNGEGTSTDADPTFTFLTSGLKNITLTTTIPGCSDVRMRSLNIEEGPATDFDFDNVCLGEVASFTDLTTGADIDPDSYMWDFGDGGNSTEINPTHIYNAPGEYQVSLSVSNTNCTIVNTQTITIHALPDAAFVNDQACVGPVQFSDVSTVEDANITAWNWDFDNGITSEEENPLVEYSVNADFNVQLEVTSNFGCVDETAQVVSVLSAPTPEFSYDQGCLGEPTQFTDQTDAETLNPITSYFWEIEDEVYTEADPEHTFDEPGTYTVTMTISTANTCSVVATEEIVIPVLPIPAFTFTTPCVNSVITFQDASSDDDDPIVSRTWDFGGEGTANGGIAQFVFSEPGTYTVGLTTVSTLGCEGFTSQEIEVNEQPVANFTSSTFAGAPPLSVDFTNLSEDAFSYEWILNDAVDPFSTEENPSLVFEEEGDNKVSLVAFNAFGCTDTVSQVIAVAVPELDLVLNEVIPVTSNDRTNIVLRGVNGGTRPIEGFDIVITLEDGITIIETYSETLLKDEVFIYTLNFELPEGRSNVGLLCVALDITTEDELNTDNNQGCINFEPQMIVQDPFPNPVSERIRVNVVLPEVEDELEVTLMNIYGEVMINERFDDVIEGLNIFDFDVRPYFSGLYIVRIRYNGREEVRRFSKD